MITKFNLFESIRDKMEGVSMDDIKKMSSISRLEWLFSLSNYDEERSKMIESLPQEFFPTNEELKKDLAELPNNSERIKAIIKHHLSYDLLPKGDLVINEEYLNWEAFELDKLPENLTINGEVNFGMNGFIEIKNLTVNGSISFHENFYLKELENVTVYGNLYLSDLASYQEPDRTVKLINVYVSGNLECQDSNIDESSTFKVEGDIIKER